MEKGSRHGNFLVTKSLFIEELKCRLQELEHISGAKVMHIENDDPENVFCLSFQTLPDDSTGVAHILEHTVLCGSEKFPVKDPFFAMTRRSLNTFMNAMTGSDFTCYPAASQVKKDFYNLLDVYIDAVFFPKLKEISFQQEGHRQEIDEEGQLVYKGVVYNEMKGAMASPMSRLYDELYRALFPDLTYGWNSGGDPKAIPDLTYGELIEFHRKYYNPSHCLFFFYGDLPLEEHLDYIEERVLKDAKKAPPIEPIGKQKRFSKAKKVQARYPIAKGEEEEAKAYIAFGWLTCHVLEQEELLALAIVETALMDTDASPLKMALLRSGLCTQVQAFVDPDISEVPIAIILKGCDAKNAEKLEEVLKNKLEELVKEGIPKHLIDNAMHQVEFHRSEITGDRAPFGLTLFMRSALLKQHGAVPEESLQIHNLFGRLLKKVEDNPNYFSSLIRKHFLDNSHFVRLVMEPDAHLEEEEAAEEKRALAEKQKSLTEEEKARIIKEAKDLVEYQIEQEKADHEVLPKVTLADVPKKSVDYPLEVGRSGPFKTFFHDTFTNQIVYVDLSWPLPAVKEEELWLVRLFATLLTQMGSGGRDYAETLEEMQANTGGLSAALNVSVLADDSDSALPRFLLSGKALYRKSEALFTLLRDFATSADFTDSKRLQEVVMKHYTALHTTLTQSAMKYALSLAASALSPSSRVNNLWYGLDYYLKVKELVENFEEKAHAFKERMEAFKSELLQLKEPHLIITCDGNHYRKMEEQGFYGLEKLQTKAFTPWSNHRAPPKVPSQGRPIASPVAFAGQAISTVPYSHPASAALSVAQNLFDNTTLHVAIREQGGAYGGGAVCNNLAGQMLFYSYRDPNIVTTLQAFVDAVEKVVEGDFDERELEEAKLEKIQNLDAPVAPGSRAEVAYNWLQEGRSLAVRQKFRDRLLKLTKEDVIAAVKEHVLPKLGEATTVVFAGRELLERENKELTKKLLIQEIE